MSKKNTIEFYNSAEAPEYPALEPGLSLDKQTVMLRLQVSGTDFRRSVKVEEIADDVVMEEVDTQFVKVSKALVHPKYIQPVNILDSSVRSTVYSMGFKPDYVGDGVVMLPVTLINQVNTMLKSYIEQRTKAVEMLVERYDQAKEEARQANGLLYRETEYPTHDEVRSKFTVSYRFFTTSIPDTIQAISQSIFEEERRKADETWEGVAEEVREALRVSFKELVASMADKVTNLGTEKRVFKQGFVENFRLFLETFEARNLTNDEELSRLVRSASDLLDGVNPDMLRKNIEVRTVVEQGLNKIKESLKDMTTTQRRMIEL
jgi:hypothetical protein